MKKKKKKQTKKIKIRYNRLFLFIFLICIIVLSVIYILNLKITNIYIKNNEYLSDQFIIDLAGISNYPKTLNYSCSKISSNLKESSYIKDVKVRKKFLTQVYIDVVENYPLFFYKTDNQTVLLDGEKIDSNDTVPIVINYIPNLKYQEFVEKMGNLDKNILNRISEIKYDPSDYDDERFLLYMNDGNYVYINLYKFLNLNKYIEIVKNFGNKKGIIYLDSGNYFEIKEN